jgi:SAM-dependent methyltransferase
MPREALDKAQLYFQNIQYFRHNVRRQEHLASLNLDLNGRSVLEVGAGTGDHTTFFLDRGCTVLALEPRPENCAVFYAAMQSRTAAGYKHAPRCRLIQCDAENVNRFVTEMFDIVYCYGLLYHVAEPAPVLANLAQRCSGLFLLETCVSPKGGEAINPIEEETGNPTQSFHGPGCRPTRQWIFNRLKEQFAHVYMPKTQPAHEEFPLDWSAGAPETHINKRAIFIASRQPIKNPLLLDHIPQHQIAA